MQVNIVNRENKETGTMDLPEDIFGVKWNPDLVHQVVTSLEATRRKPFAHAKDRSEVRGGGKKPWKQKGTGRARHGSSRSPIWVGGGATFGPNKEKSFTRKVNKKMKRAALYAIVSKKLKDGEVKIIDAFRFASNGGKPKTKELASAVKNIIESEKKKTKPTTLLIAKEGEKNTILAGRNIARNKVLYPSDVNIIDSVSHKIIMFEKVAMEQFIENQTKNH